LDNGIRCVRQIALSIEFLSFLKIFEQAVKDSQSQAKKLFLKVIAVKTKNY
jgi:hypothetical protein